MMNLFSTLPLVTVWTFWIGLTNCKKRGRLHSLPLILGRLNQNKVNQNLTRIFPLFVPPHQSLQARQALREHRPLLLALLAPPALAPLARELEEAEAVLVSARNR
jgi:hypothetical protein